MLDLAVLSNQSYPTWWSSSNKVATRIDKIFLSKSLKDNITTLNLENVSYSDHVELSFILSPVSKIIGSGLWKLNTSLLQKDYIVKNLEEIATTILETKFPPFSKYKAFINMSRDYLKLESKINSVKIASDLHNAKERLVTLTQQHKPDWSEIDILKKNIKEIEDKAFTFQKEVILKKKCFFEKPSKAFFNQMEAVKSSHYIKSLENEGNLPPLEFAEKYFADFYSKRNPDQSEMNSFLKELHKFHLEENVNITDINNLNKPITVEELQTALSSMKNHKSPGEDGLPAEFYKAVPSSLKIIKLIWDHSLITCHLPDEMTRGVIKLLPKS